jgi:hypothetical protein
VGGAIGGDTLENFGCTAVQQDYSPASKLRPYFYTSLQYVQDCLHYMTVCRKHAKTEQRAWAKEYICKLDTELPRRTTQVADDNSYVEYYLMVSTWNNMCDSAGDVAWGERLKTTVPW